MGADAEPGAWWEKEKWLFDFGLAHPVSATGEFCIRYWQNHGDREAFNTRREAAAYFIRNSMTTAPGKPPQIIPMISRIRALRWELISVTLRMTGMPIMAMTFGIPSGTTIMWQL